MTPITISFNFATSALAAAFLASLGNAPAVAATPTPAAPAPAPQPTRYFFDAAHNNLFSVQPGQPVPSVPGAQEITEAQYNTVKANLAAAFATAQTAAAPSSVTAASPAPAAVGAVDDPFGATLGAPTAAPMTAAQFSDQLKAKCAAPEARVKLTAFLKVKGAANVGALVAGKSDAELGALFAEAAAAVA